VQQGLCRCADSALKLVKGIWAVHPIAHSRSRHNLCQWLQGESEPDFGCAVGRDRVDQLSVQVLIVLLLCPMPPALLHLQLHGARVCRHSADRARQEAPDAGQAGNPASGLPHQDPSWCTGGLTKGVYPPPLLPLTPACVFVCHSSSTLALFAAVCSTTMC